MATAVVARLCIAVSRRADCCGDRLVTGHRTVEAGVLLVSGSPVLDLYCTCRRGVRLCLWPFWPCAGTGLVVSLPVPAPLQWLLCCVSSGCGSLCAAVRSAAICLPSLPASPFGQNAALLPYGPDFKCLIGSVAKLFHPDVAAGVQHLRDGALGDAKKLSDLRLRSSLGKFLKGNTKVVVHTSLSVSSLPRY